MKTKNKTQTSEAILDKYGIVWINQKENERLVDGCDRKLYKEMKYTDTTSEIGEEIFLLKMSEMAFGKPKQFRMKHLDRFLQAVFAFRSVEHLPEFFWECLEVELGHNHRLTFEGIDFDGNLFLEKIKNAENRKNLTKEEKKKWEVWIPGFELKSRFNPTEIEKQVKEELKSIAGMLDEHFMPVRYSWKKDEGSDRFYNDILPELRREMNEKFSLNQKLKAFF